MDDRATGERDVDVDGDAMGGHDGGGRAVGGLAVGDDGRRDALARLVAAWADQRNGDGDSVDPATVSVVEVEELWPGRPGLLDVIADVAGQPVHAVLGLHRPGDEVHLLRNTDQPALGLFDDRHGLALVVDALRDAELAPLVLAAVTGDEPPGGTVVSIADTPDLSSLAFGDHCTLTVFARLGPSPHPAVELLTVLDDAGFNHLAAPLARWRRGGRDLGVVQEKLAGSTGARALVLTSLRDLYAFGGRPEDAGADFGPDARALGTMTARMHLCLDRALGRRSVAVTDWLDCVEASASEARPASEARQATEARPASEGRPTSVARPAVAEAVAALRKADLRGAVIQTHGDFHLGRIVRTDYGWVVADCRPGGVPPGGDRPVMRSPLADVADLLWSLHHAAVTATADRDPADRAAAAPLADAWVARNGRAFMAGYLATPGIGGLLPTNRDHTLALVAVFELAREAGVVPPA